MHKARMESTIVICLLGIAMSAVPSLAQVPEGIYGTCYRVTESGKEPANYSTVYLVRLDNSTTYTCETGDGNVARFADYVPPGTWVPSDYWYKMRARKLYGDCIWESPWTDSLDYWNGAHIERDLDMVFTGQSQR